MLTYIFDQNSGCFIREYECPKGAFGEDLVPVYSTEVPPPEVDQTTQTCCWNGAEWLVHDIAVPEPQADPVASPEQQWALRQSAARTAFAATGKLAVECVKIGMAYPAEWRSYSDGLLEILTENVGDSGAALPDQPQIPDGINPLAIV